MEIQSEIGDFIVRKLNGVRRPNSEDNGFMISRYTIDECPSIYECDNCKFEYYEVSTGIDYFRMQYINHLMGRENRVNIYSVHEALKFLQTKLPVP